MPTNTPQKNGSSAVVNQTTSTGKKSKAGGTRAKAGSGRKSVAPAASAEILYEVLPNPYHPPVPPYIWIDHPEQNERLLGAVYVIRLGVGGAESVELSIDNGAWQKCRLTSGYWWYDWSAIKPGPHTLTARMQTTDGRWFRTPVRSCEFKP